MVKKTSIFFPNQVCHLLIKQLHSEHKIVGPHSLFVPKQVNFPPIKIIPNASGEEITKARRMRQALQKKVML